MAEKKKAPVQAKPYLKGAPADENTVRQAAKFFGALILVAFMSFIVCSMTSFNSVILRILVNTVIESLILIIFYSKGAELGTDAVARGEILYQHVQKGQEVAPSEKRIPFHKTKGFIIGLCGTSVFFLLALILAFTAEKQMTEAGTLPAWTEAFMRRSEIGNALVSYTVSPSISFQDIIRIIIRVMIMPFISMAGAENRGILLVIERISPFIILLPALAYGTGYLQGPSRRKSIHSEIAANNRRRISREKKERKARRAAAPKGPEKLN